MWLSGIIMITNSNGDSASPWKISLRILTLTKPFPPAVNSTLKISMVFSTKFSDFVGYFVHFQTEYYPSLGGWGYVVNLFLVNPGNS